MSIKLACELILKNRLNNVEIAKLAGKDRGTIRRYRERLAEEGFSLADVVAMDDESISLKINSKRFLQKNSYDEPDFSYVHKELQRKGVTLKLLHAEYAENACGNAMAYTTFVRAHNKYRKSRGLVMRQIHKPGHELFLDYSGFRPEITDRITGEKTKVELFVAVFGYSRKTFAYATATQKLHDWCEANVRALNYFGGVPCLLVPDNLKSAVSFNNSKKGIVINPTYKDLADYYGTIVSPARPRKPKDKAHVEKGVLHVQRWALAVMRDEVFYSLSELNARLAELVESINTKRFTSKALKHTNRNELFQSGDFPALDPLPVERWHYAVRSTPIRVPTDYHVEFEGRAYSVPSHYRGQMVVLRVSHSRVDIYKSNSQKVIATHFNTDQGGPVYTIEDHRPDAHKGFSQEDLDALHGWAARTGSSVVEFLRLATASHSRPFAPIKLGNKLQRLARIHGDVRLNAACARAIRLNTSSIKSVESMLDRHIENKSIRADECVQLPRVHDQIRGPEFYS